MRAKVVRKKWRSLLARAPVADHGVHEALRNPLQKGEASGRPPALLAGSPVTKSDPWCAGASPRVDVWHPTGPCRNQDAHRTGASSVVRAEAPCARPRRTVDEHKRVDVR